MFKHNGYKIECSPELRKDIEGHTGTINWFNLNANDIYYDEYSEGHVVRSADHKLKAIVFKW